MRSPLKSPLHEWKKVNFWTRVFVGSGNLLQISGKEESAFFFLEANRGNRFKYINVNRDEGQDYYYGLASVYQLWQYAFICLGTIFSHNVPCQTLALKIWPYYKLYWRFLRVFYSKPGIMNLWITTLLSVLRENKRGCQCKKSWHGGKVWSKDSSDSIFLWQVLQG